MVDTDREPVVSGEFTAYLSLGANLGRRRESLRSAVMHLHDHLQISLDLNLDVARLYETSPVGCSRDHPLFLNSAVRVRTSLGPLELLDTTQGIERLLGRQRSEAPQRPGVHDRQYRSRSMDIDVLLYGDLIHASDRLVVPHPRLSDRLFVLTPLADLAPNLILPGGRTVSATLHECQLSFTHQAIEKVEGADWAQPFNANR